MHHHRIADALSIQPRYARSVHVEQDFHDLGALEGYVVTTQVRESLQRLLEGLNDDSTQRAWRITGDYGSGKSSFALAVARLLGGQNKGLPKALRSKALAVNGRKALLPVLVVGSRSRLTSVVVTALGRALRACHPRGRPPELIIEIEKAVAGRSPVTDDLALEFIGKAADYVCETGVAGGLLIVIDELGKFLEYTALRPDQQDIYFLQRLAEMAARSGDAPVFVLSLLHQGFAAYAANVSDLARREWEKVAGRFAEILFNQPLEQLAHLAADALGVRSDRINRQIDRRARSAMQAAIDFGWYGSLANRAELLDLATRLYPLHPTVLPVAAKVFTRFGQNERSFFSFLLSNEPFALRSFAERSNSLGEFYRLHHFFDYVRSSMGLALATTSYKSHWNVIDSLISSFPASDVQSLQVLKTVGVVNLIDDQGIIATDRSIEISVAEWTESDREAISRSTKSLQKGKRVLYQRGAAGGLCLWPYTSVNVERAYQDARRACDVPAQIAPLLNEYMDVSPLVARRHYIETGNFRVFAVSPTSVDALSTMQFASASDGRILIVTPETSDERDKALSLASTAITRPDILIAVTQPLAALGNLLAEVRRWEWVLSHTPELAGDTFAAEEVSRQLNASRRIVAERVRDLVGIGPSGVSSGVAWFRAGQRQDVSTGKELITFLSDVCDELYPNAPVVQNELINRTSLSSAAAAARMRLIERILDAPSEPLLGLEPQKSPPEKSMYLSVLERGRLHRKVRGVWSIGEPSAKDDPLRLRPAFQHMRVLLEATPDARVPVDRILRELCGPPFGVRAGLAPMLLAVLVSAHREELAVYENEAFLQSVGGLEFLRLTKAPETFSLQLCKLAGVRAAVFGALRKMLESERVNAKQPTLLDVVRPLCMFASKLPAHTSRTRHLSAAAIAVRTVLLDARDPSKLLFCDLPQACGFEPFVEGSSDSAKRARAFASTLRTAIDELRASYPKLLDAIRARLALAFDSPSSTSDLRTALAASAQRLVFHVVDVRLKGLCLRLADRHLGDSEWIEAIGSFICSKPPTRWTDLDAEFFGSELTRLVALLRRVQAASFGQDGSYTSLAVRIAVTFADGSDVSQVIQIAPDEEARAADIEAEITRILVSDGRVGIAGASRAIKRVIESREVSADSPTNHALTEVCLT